MCAKQQEETKGFEVISVRMQCLAKMTGMCQNCQNVISNLWWQSLLCPKGPLAVSKPISLYSLIEIQNKTKNTKNKNDWYSLSLNIISLWSSTQQTTTNAAAFWVGQLFGGHYHLVNYMVKYLCSVWISHRICSVRVPKWYNSSYCVAQSSNGWW